MSMSREGEPMRFQIYHNGQLAAVCEYGVEPTYHGEVGETVRAVIEANRPQRHLAEASLAEVPAQWLNWAASIVYPVLSAGALVRWYG